jgi:hypothetical protein
MPGFVVEYNRKSHDWKVTEFPGADGHRNALIRRIEIEGDRPGWEVVSLTSDSLETIKKTHARYFEGKELLSP